MATERNSCSPYSRQVQLSEAIWTWCRVALLSFGGPAGQIAVMHRIIVQEKKWISEERFMHALNYCMLLPGPEAQQLATYIGWLMHRTLGGLMAGLIFIFPGAVSILGLSVIYAVYGQVSIVQAVFFGLKPAIIAVVIQAVIRIGSRVLKNRMMVWLAVLAFVSIFAFEVPFPVIIVVGAIAGLLGQRFAPEQFSVRVRHSKLDSVKSNAGQPEAKLHVPSPSLQRACIVISIGAVAWFVPLLAVVYFWGNNSVYSQQGVFFSKAAIVTFGGAYSVLAYIAQQAVEKYAWLEPGEMMDGLGMAESTPGPLIMVVQFVGFMAAYRNPGEFSPITAGILGSLITTWVTFVPCFLWIFLGAPYIEKLRDNQAIGAALSSITAMVVGVVLNLAIWFSLHTLFAKIESKHIASLRVLVPDLTSISWGATFIALLSVAMTFWWKRSLFVTLVVAMISGIAWKMLVR